MLLSRLNDATKAPELDLTPVIDMVFLLLIFFLAATTFHQTERELEILLPEAHAAGPISAALKEIVVNVDARGDVTVGGRRVDRQALEALLTAAVAANPQQKVSVRGDRSAAYAHVAQVLDACKTAGVDAPFLDTLPAP